MEGTYKEGLLHLEFKMNDAFNTNGVVTCPLRFGCWTGEPSGQSWACKQNYISAQVIGVWKDEVKCEKSR